MKNSTTTGGPTPSQIQQVQTNLRNMQSFNDYVYDTGAVAKVLNAYLLLSEQDGSDPGLTIGLNILEGAFWAAGSEFGPAGNFAASFLSGMLSWWATNTPPNLNGTFSSMLTRLQATKIQVDQTLAGFYQDVAGNWNTQFTFNGQTSTLSDFATVNFPAETDPTFEKMATAAIFAMDQSIWTTILQAKFVVTLWESSGDMPMSGSPDDPPVSWDEMFIANNPAYYNTWGWHQKSGCGDTSGWIINEYNLGSGAGVFTDGSISNDACNYLFIDSADGVVINAAALFARAKVFTGIGIRQTTYYVPTGGGGATVEKLSTDYLRAMKTGQTLGLLIEREGREAVQQRVIAEAQKDSVFATNLKFRPRDTLERFLGVKIPDVVGISVIVETPRSFAIVVPMVKLD